MDFDDDPYLDVCQNIEAGLCREYDINPELTDTKCTFALDAAKVAIKQKFGFAKNQKVNRLPGTEGVIDWCVEVGLARIDKVNDLTLKEYVAQLEKIRKSVERHSAAGPRGYYEFIKDYV
jgi:hypothetical protein